MNTNYNNPASSYHPPQSRQTYSQHNPTKHHHTPTHTHHPNHCNHHAYHIPSPHMPIQCAVYNCKRLTAIHLPSSSIHHPHHQHSHRLTSNQAGIAQLCFPSIASQELIKKGDILCDTHYSMLSNYAVDVASHAGRNLLQFSTSWHQHDENDDIAASAETQQHLEDANNIMMSSPSGSGSQSNEPSPSHTSMTLPLSYQNDAENQYNNEQHPNVEPNSALQSDKFTYPPVPSKSASTLLSIPYNTSRHPHPRSHHDTYAYGYDDTYDMIRALLRGNMMRSKVHYTLTTVGWMILIIFISIILLYSIISIKNGTLFQ